MSSDRVRFAILNNFELPEELFRLFHYTLHPQLAEVYMPRATLWFVIICSLLSHCVSRRLDCVESLRASSTATTGAWLSYACAADCRSWPRENTVTVPSLVRSRTVKITIDRVASVHLVNES
jgi:hypothetical protein